MGRFSAKINVSFTPYNDQGMQETNVAYLKAREIGQLMNMMPPSTDFISVQQIYIQNGQAYSVELSHPGIPDGSEVELLWLRNHYVDHTGHFVEYNMLLGVKWYDANHEPLYGNITW